VPIAVGLLALGCGTTHLVAPPGREVYIVPADKPAEVHVERTIWFYQWGEGDLGQHHARGHRTVQPARGAHRHLPEMVRDADELITSIVSIQRRTLIVRATRDAAARVAHRRRDADRDARRHQHRVLPYPRRGAAPERPPAAADAPVEVRREYQVFYYAWGLFPDGSSDQVMYIIEQEHLVEARHPGRPPRSIIAGFFG
jgi:hypothetical protein